MSDGALQADTTEADGKGADTTTGSSAPRADRSPSARVRGDDRQANENRKERVDRELIELLNELRVALPGVQVLLAFLLTVPFTERFTVLDDRTRTVYFAAVITAAVSSILLIAPSVHHRMRFRKGAKEQLLHAANVMALAGTLFLAVSVAAVVYVIADVTYGDSTANVAAALIGAGAILLWFAAPLLYGNDLEADT
jgi:hypothetical protein